MARRGPVAALAGLALVAGLMGATPPAQAATPTDLPAWFDFSGSGFGHGVGMSQYGAAGMAKEGSTPAQIITHYYTGSAVAAVPDAMDLRVNLLHAVSTATIGSKALTTGGGGVELDPSGGASSAPVLGTAADTWTLGVSGTNVTVSRAGAVVATAPLVTFHWAGTRVPNAAGSAATVLTVNGTAYRYGTVDARVVAGQLEVVNAVRLHDEYLLGLGEMPSSWPAAALQAQVIASRSFALSRYASGLRSACACHVYDTTSDQVFVGYSKESGAYGAQWAAAVAATDSTPTTGLAVTVAGKTVPAYFFSSSGGKTQNSEDVWSTALSFTRSVDDHWSLDPTLNPTYAAWTRTLTQAAVAAAFGLADVATWKVVARYVSGAVKQVTATSSTGATATITGAQLASRLVLPSTWVKDSGAQPTAALLPVQRLAGADRYATAVAVGKVAAPTATTVVLVSGENDHLVDGMVSGPLAAKLGAPILLATSSALPAVTAAELTRRKATTVYLVGGASALGAGLEKSLAALGVTTVKRVAGADRFSTAAAVAQAMGVAAGTPAVVVNGTSLADAMAAAGPAAGAGRPILLVQAGAVPAATRAELTALGSKAVTVVGGTGVVSDAVLAQLPTPYRAGGASRYATSVAVTQAFSSLLDMTQVALTAGSDGSLVDALAASPLGRATLYTSAQLPPEVAVWLKQASSLQKLLIIGGTGVLTDQVVVAAVTAFGAG
jgi:stage II sporulation protein D